MDLDFRKILNMPNVYRLFSDLVGAKAFRETYVKLYVMPKLGNAVLDIGCGPADILEHLPKDIQYYGFDMDEDYIIAAQERFGNRGQFCCKLVDNETLNDLSNFDIVLANGVLHHLDDQQARQLFSVAYRALKPGGRLVTHDGCFVNDQSWLTKKLLASDRGSYLRDEENYRLLAHGTFENVKSQILHGMLRIPYTHIIMTCTKEA